MMLNDIQQNPFQFKNEILFIKHNRKEIQKRNLP